MEATEQPKDGRGCDRIEVPGRLVAQQQLWLVDERAGDGDSLAFATRQPGWQVPGSAAEANSGERRAGAFGSAGSWPPPIGFRQHHVLEHRPVREQVERLEDEAQVAAAKPGPLAVGERCDVDTVEPVGPGALSIQATDDVEQT